VKKNYYYYNGKAYKFCKSENIRELKKIEIDFETICLNYLVVSPFRVEFFMVLGIKSGKGIKFKKPVLFNELSLPFIKSVSAVNGFIIIAYKNKNHDAVISIGRIQRFTKKIKFSSEISFCKNIPAYLKIDYLKDNKFILAYTELDNERVGKAVTGSIVDKNNLKLGKVSFFDNTFNF